MTLWRARWCLSICHTSILNPCFCGQGRKTGGFVHLFSVFSPLIKDRHQRTEYFSAGKLHLIPARFSLFLTFVGVDKDIGSFLEPMAARVKKMTTKYNYDERRNHARITKKCKKKSLKTSLFDEHQVYCWEKNNPTKSCGLWWSQNAHRDPQRLSTEPWFFLPNLNFPIRANFVFKRPKERSEKINCGQRWFDFEKARGAEISLNNAILQIDKKSLTHLPHLKQTSPAPHVATHSAWRTNNLVE